MTDASAGSITHRRILNIAVPIVVSNATVPILGAVDTGVIGQLGEAAPIGAVGIGSIILTTIYWVFGFLRMSTSGLTSQARGIRDTTEVSALLVRSLVFGIGAGILIALLHVPIFWAAFQIAPASAEVETLAGEYVSVRVMAAPATIAVFGMTGWLIACERTRAVLVLQLVTNGINILLDLLFVLHMDLGVRGVAYASAIAEYAGFALGLWLCRPAFAVPGWRDAKRLFDIGRLRGMAGMNADILIRTLLLEAAFVSLLFIAADLGDVTLAANQILFQFLHITAYALDGFAFSAEALVGLTMGARQRAALRRAVLLACLWAGMLVLVLSAGFAALGPAIIDVMTTAPDVRLEARTYLIWVILAPAIGGPSWMLDGIFIGAMRTRDMRNGMAISCLAYAAAVALLVPHVGNHGLWIGLQVLFVARAATLGLHYLAIERSAS